MLALFCLGIGARFLVRPSPRRAEKPGGPARSRQAGTHHAGAVHFDVLAKLLDDDRRSAPADAWLRELADPRAPFRVETQRHPLLHRAAPDLVLTDHEGRSWSLKSRLQRGPVVLVFYLGYACTACVHNLLELSADLERFRELGAEVAAISGDLPALTRRRFKQYGIFRLSLLSDPDHAAARAHGIFSPATASKPEELLHGTFVIGRDGLVHWAHCSDAPFHNVKALLHELARLEGKLPPASTAGGERRERKG
jgi:peroxiredoxin Q/BCP